MEDNDNRRRLYDNLYKEFQLPEYNQFSEDMKDETKRKRLWENVGKEYQLPDFDQFSKDMGYETQTTQQGNQNAQNAKKPQQTVQSSHVEEGRGLSSDNGYSKQKTAFDKAAEQAWNNLAHKGGIRWTIKGHPEVKMVAVTDDLVKRFPQLEQSRGYQVPFNMSTGTPIMQNIDDKGNIITPDEASEQYTKILTNQDFDYVPKQETAAVQIGSVVNTALSTKGGWLDRAVQKAMEESYGKDWKNRKYVSDGKEISSSEIYAKAKQGIYDNINGVLGDIRKSLLFSTDEQRRQTVDELYQKGYLKEDFLPKANALHYISNVDKGEQVEELRQRKLKLQVQREMVMDKLNQIPQPDHAENMAEFYARRANDGSELYASDLRKIDKQIAQYDAVIDELEGRNNLKSEWGHAVQTSGITDIGAWDFGITDLKDAMMMYPLARKMQNGENITQDDFMSLKLLAQANDADAVENAVMPSSYNMFKGSLQSVPFTVQFGAGKTFAEGAASVVNKAATRAVKGAILKAGGKKALRAAEKVAEKAAESKILKFCGMLGKDFEKAFVMENTTGAATTGAEILNRHIGTVTESDDGFKMEGESLPTAIIKGEISQNIESQTEFLGEHFPSSLNFIRGMVHTKVGSAMGLRNLAAWLTKVSRTEFATTLKSYATKAGINGVLGEYLEEVAGTAENALLVGDQKFSDLFDVTQQEEVAGSVVLSCLGMGIFGTAIYTGQRGLNMPAYYRLQHIQNKWDNTGLDLFTGEEWAKLKDRIDNTPNEGMKFVMADILRGQNMTEEQMRAAYNYASCTLTLRGMNLGAMKAAQLGLTDDRHIEQDNAYVEGRQAKDEDKHDIQIEFEDRSHELAEKLGISEQQLDNMSDEELESLTGKDDQLDNLIYDYQTSHAKYQGVVDNADDEIDKAAQEAARQTDMATDKSRGTVRNATIKAAKGEEDYGVYIVSGNVATNEDSSINVSESDDMILYYDPKSGKIEHCDAMRLAALGEEVNAEETRNQAIADAKEKAIRKQAGIIDGTVGEGTSFTITDAEGNEHTYEVLADNGDGSAMITMDGNVQDTPVSLQDLQNLKDAEEAKRLEAAKMQRQQYEEEREKQNAPVEDNLDYADIINTNGNVEIAEVVDEEGNAMFPNAEEVFFVQNQGNRAKVMVLDSEGNLQPKLVKKSSVRTLGTMSVDEYRQGRQQALKEAENASEPSLVDETETSNNVVPTGNITTDNTTTNETQPGNKAEVTTSNETQNISNEQENTPKITLEDGTEVPMLEDGNPDFSQLTAGQVAELYDSQFGEDAGQIITNNVNRSKKALDKANAMTVSGGSFVEQKASKEAKDKAIAEAKEKYDSAKAIEDAYNERMLAKEEDSPEGRMNLIEKARRKFNRMKGSVKDNAQAIAQLYDETVGALLHRLYDSTGIDVFDDTANTVDEYVASSIAPYSLNYEGMETSKGVKQETGLSRSDFAKTGLLAKEGKGKTIGQLANDLWRDRPSNLENITDQDVRNAIIDLITSGQTAFGLKNHIQNLRIAEAENILEQQKRQADELAHAEKQKEEESQSTEMVDNNAEESSNTEATPADAQEEDKLADMPFEAPSPDKDAPFSAKDKAKDPLEVWNNMTDEEKAAYIENNRVKDTRLVDDVVGKKLRKAIEKIAGMMGATIQWQRTDMIRNGWLNPNTKTIYLALDSSVLWGVQFVFGHEMTHDIKTKSPAMYEELKGLVKEKYGEEKFETMTNKNEKRYAGVGKTDNDRSYYEEETVADAIGATIRDLNLTRSLALKMSHPLLAKMHDVLLKIKNAFKETPYKEKTNGIIRTIEMAYVKTANGTFESSASEGTNDDENVLYSLRQKPEPEKKGTGYKVFVLGKDGKLYPPMVANPNGAATPVGVWLDADAAPVAGESKTGRPQVKQGGKGTQGGSGKLAYRPGWHLGVIPYAIQFNRKDAEGNKTLFPKNFVFAEVEYAADKDYQDEAHAEGINSNGKYQHSLAGLKHLPTDGYYMYRTNPNPETDPWVITGAMKVNRLLTRAEQADIVRKAGREPQQIQEGDIVTDDVVNSINQEIAAAPKFSLKVYHGSGADFTEFDFDHMGEGAGTQAFGWGGYVTSSKKIGKSYATLMDNDPSKAYYRIQRSNGTRFAKKYPTLESFLHGDKQIAMNDKFTEQEKIDYYNEMKKLAEPYHNLYEVDIPDDNGSNYLEWEKKPSNEVATKIIEGIYGLDDKTLDDMAARDIVFRTLMYDYIKNADKEQMIPILVKTNGLTRNTVYDNGNVEDDMRFVYNRLSNWMGSQKAASKFLSSLGFTGIKYPAGTIYGGAEEGDVNYVIFKPEDMQIVEHEKFSVKKKIFDPREISDTEKQRRGDMLIHATPVDVAKDQIIKTDNLSARKVAEQWWRENIGSPLYYETEIGKVEINENSIQSSLAHRYGQAKLDAITSLKDGFNNAVYLGTIPDFVRTRDDVQNHYFAYPINYDGKRCYVFCRAMEDANKNSLYVHEVFIADNIQKEGNTLQTAAFKPHGGIALYKHILSDVLSAANIANPSETSKGNAGKFSLRLQDAINETDTEPTEAQKKSGNYKKGHVKFGGYDYTIENPKGSYRSGVDENGKEWKQKMNDTYGYIRGKFGKDGDHLDMFINDKADLDSWNGDVFVVDQVNQDGTFDEHKVMYGYDSLDEAKKAYLSNYEKGWTGLGNITPVSKAGFDKWLDKSNRKLKPFADYADITSKTNMDTAPSSFEEFLEHPAVRYSIRNEKERAAAEDAYNFVQENRPDRYSRYAIVNMEKPGAVPQYLEKKAVADNWRRYYNKLKWGNYKLFDLDKPFEDNVKNLVGKFPETFRKKNDTTLSKINELTADYNKRKEEYDAMSNSIQELLNGLMKQGRSLAEAESVIRDWGLYKEMDSKYQNLMGIRKQLNELRSGKVADDERFSLIGKKGAEALDHAEEVSTRLDNLNVARQMEGAKKDAKAIKMATGWERGADGKWRYEIADSKLNDMMDVDGKGKMVKRHKEDMLWTSGKLGEVVVAPELFKAYPKLKDVRLETDSIMNNLPSNGEYNAKTNTITIHADELKYLDSILNHEIQHAIQHIEGFARGGNPEYLQWRIEAAKKEWRARAWADALRDKAEEMGEHYNQVEVEKALIDEYKEMGMDNDEWMPDKETRIKGFNYFARGYADRSFDDDIRAFRLNESTRSDYNSYVEYTKLGGEVEARNVQSRMNMSPEERRKTLAEETEDVARKDQIFLYGDSVSMMGSRAFNEAINSSDNIRFSLKSMMEKPEGWKQANKKAIHIAEAIERDPKFSLKNLDGTLIKAGTYFSGGGLVEEGLKGIIDPVVAVEYDEKISGVYRNNFGNHIVTADVRDVDPKELVGKIDGEVEYFHASPVCKNYSLAKNNHEELELDKETAASTAEFISKVRPKVVTIENVKGYKDSEAMKTITDALDEAGYKWDADVYNAADYGGYTNRERLIVRAVRDGELPAKPEKQKRKSGWYEAVEDIMPTLTEKKNGVAPWMDERLKADGIDWRHIDKPLYVMGSGYANGTVPHAFADELLPTLRTKSGDVIVMPDGKVYRAMGRVLARVSGVSDDYQMPASEALSHTIIGNGIPTQLTENVIAPLVRDVLHPEVEEKASLKDAEYLEAVRSGDMEKAQKMVYDAARAAGYVNGTEYQGEGSWNAPSASVEKKDFANLDALRESVEEYSGDTNVYGIINGVTTNDDDFYYNPGRVGFRDAAASETSSVLRRLRYDKADANTKVKVFRTVPADVKGNNLMSGDWIALSKQYCIEHGNGRYGEGGYRIIEEEVPIKTIWNDGNDMREFGFDDGNNNEAEKNVPNNRKLLDAVTYDNNGNVIPLSERFNESNDDIRYSLKNKDRKQAQLDIILKTNPMLDDYHTGIRKVEDIKTLGESVEEARSEAEKYGYDEWSAYPDITNDMLQNALETGEITIYSSKPIKNGVFVTPSYMQASDYAGGGNVYEKTVPLTDVAWINTDEGQYAKVDGERYSLKEVNDKFNDRLAQLIENPNQKDRVLHLGRSSQFLIDGGIADAEIELDFDKLMRKSKFGYVHEHPFDAADVKDLPLAIANPISVFVNTNGQNDGQVILTELKKDDRNFIVVIRTESQNRKGGVILKVNKIATLFPKDARGVINWYNLGKATNIDKAKALHFIEALQNHSGTLTSEELSSAAKIVRNFVNPKQNDGNLQKTEKYSLRVDRYRDELNQWKKDNNLPKDAERPQLPVREPNENAADFLKRVKEYRKQAALWATAPTYEDHLLVSDTAQGQFNLEMQRKAVLTRIVIQDSMLAIRKAQEAIMKEVGVDKLNFAEDAYTAENRSHGKAKNEFEEYNDEFLQPLRKAYNELMQRLGKSYDNVKVYMIAKHGLERNAYIAFKYALDEDYETNEERMNAYKNYKADMDRLNNDADFEAGRIDFAAWKQRDGFIRTKYAPSYFKFRFDENGMTKDYSGLSALFDADDYEGAAADLVKEVEDANPYYTDELWYATNDATKKILRDSYNAGMMTEDNFNFVSGMYRNYIPLRGWGDTNADQVWNYVGGGKGAFNQVVKEAKGRKSLADDPIAYIENMAESAILMNNRNWVKQHLLLLAQNHRTSLLNVSKAWYIKTKDAQGNGEWIPASPQITEGMTGKQVEAALEAFEQKMEQMKQNGEATQKREHLEISYPQTNGEEREHEVRVMKGGEEYVIYVNGDPQLAQAVNNTRARKVREGLESSISAKVIARTGRYMAAAYTSMSPLFIPSNYMRDLTMTLASTAIREDARYNYLLRRNMLRHWNTFPMVLSYQNGTLREKVRNGSASRVEQMFYDFMMNGGETGFVTSVDVEDLKKKFRNDLKDLNRMAANPKKVGHIIMNSIETLNRAIEDSNRFMVYMTSIEYGRSIEEAVNNAKDVTLNFNRKGTGEHWMQNIRNLYLFINPAIQSLQTLGALAKHHRFKFTTVTTGWLASGLLAPMLNNLLMSFFGGDDDKDKYWQFTKWDRRNNFIMWIPFTKEFVKIPLAQEFRGFYGVGDMIASKLWGGEKAEESWRDYAVDLAGQIVDMLPLDPTGYDGNVLIALMPNVFRPIFELGDNVDFTGKPIFRNSEYNKYDPNFTKAYVGTPDWLVRISKMVNSIDNKYPDVQQNAIDRFGDPRFNLNNPAVVDHVLSSYLGGAYTMGSQILGVATKALNGDDIKMADIPLASKFVSNPDDRPVSKKQGEEFWDMKERHDRAANTLSKLKKKAKVDGDYSTLDIFFGSDEYRQYKEDDKKVKKYEEDRKKEKAQETGEEYRPHKTTADDVYKSHTTPKDDFEDMKMKQLYEKLNSYKIRYEAIDGISGERGEAYYKANKAAIDAIEEIAYDKSQIASIKKGFLSDGQNTYDADGMKDIRELRKRILDVLEKANKVMLNNRK